MYSLNSKLGIEENRPMMVVGGAGSVRDHNNEIVRLIDDKGLATIGINKMPYIIPKYHLWTNTQRYRDMGDSLDPSSIMMFGSGLSKKIIKMHYKQDDYIVVNYTSDLKDAKAESICYRRGRIHGYLRTAGCLAIMICHLFKASEIYVVGMDGFTLYSREELNSGEKNQHCYGAGYTDKDGWDVCLKKDEIVYDNLRELRDYGIPFKIITPTVFEDFFDGSILEIDNG